MKLVNLNQLLFHPKTPSLSFFLCPIGKNADPQFLENFLGDLSIQLAFTQTDSFGINLEKHKAAIKKIIALHSDRSHGFFFCDTFQGYVVLDNNLESFFSLGETFHVRPLLEELFVNPEYMVVNVSLYDIKIYRGDFTHVEIIQQYEFAHLPKGLEVVNSSRLYAPEFLGLIPYKTTLAIKTIAHKVKDMILYHSLPVIITGLDDMKKLFLKHFDDSTGLINLEGEDLYEKTCVQILDRCRTFRPKVLDYYSSQLKDRLKRMMKSRKYISDLDEIVKATILGKIVHLVLPPEQKLWGTIDLETGEYEIHAKLNKKSSVDILNELAEEVIKQGGQVQILRSEFFPQKSYALAILKG